MCACGTLQGGHWGANGDGSAAVGGHAILDKVHPLVMPRGHMDRDVFLQRKGCSIGVKYVIRVLKTYFCADPDNTQYAY